MTNQDKICCHYCNGECELLAYRKSPKAELTAMKCTGWDDKCKFAKTAQQFTDDNDRAIFVCRQKGLCDTCKYVDVKCKMSMEG